MMKEWESYSQRGRKLDLHFPCSPITPNVIAEHARNPEVRQRLLEALHKIEHDDIDAWRVEGMELGLKALGNLFDYQDNVTIAHSFTELAKPANMLEIGVRRGYLTSSVVSANPDIDICLVDLWEGSYSNRENPGPDLIRRQLASIGHRGKVEFYKGNSHEMLPKVFQDHPTTTFDLIIVDGDHTLDGANEDLRDVFPRVSPGGLIVFDDISHPSFPWLLDLWHKWEKTLALDFRFREYLDHAHGVGWAVRSFEKIRSQQRSQPFLARAVRKIYSLFNG